MAGERERERIAILKTEQIEERIRRGKERVRGGTRERAQVDVAVHSSKSGVALAHSADDLSPDTAGDNISASTSASAASGGGGGSGGFRWGSGRCAGV